MRIVHLSDCFPPRTGGIETQVYELAVQQAAAGHEVHVLTGTIGADGERGGAVQEYHGVQVHRLGARMPWDVPVSLFERRLIRAELAPLAPDVVHVHVGVVSPFAIDGAQVAVAAALPTAITWHSLFDGAATILRPAVRLSRWGRVPVALRAVSELAAAQVSGMFPAATVVVVPNGIDVAAWAPAPRIAGDRAGGRGPLRLVAAMQLAPRKRAVPLVHLVAQAVRQLPPGRLHLTLVGGGPSASAVQKAVADEGLGHVVTLAGELPHENIRFAYGDADVFVAPAVLEPFGQAALEARAAGLVVVARTGTGIAEHLEDGVEGLLVPDDAAMVDALVRLARDSALLDAMRAHNRAVPPDYDWSRVLPLVDQQYARARALRSA